MNDYDVSTDSWILRETHNPCSMYVDILTNTVLNQNPIEFTDSYFNMNALKSFHAWCAGDNDDSIEYTCNGVLSSETTLEQELQRIVSTGRAEFSVMDGKYTVIQDIPQATPVQMFTARNMLKDSFTAVRSFEKIPNKIIIEFVM